MSIDQLKQAMKELEIAGRQLRKAEEVLNEKQKAYDEKHTAVQNAVVEMKSGVKAEVEAEDVAV